MPNFQLSAAVGLRFATWRYARPKWPTECRSLAGGWQKSADACTESNSGGIVSEPLL